MAVVKTLCVIVFASIACTTASNSQKQVQKLLGLHSFVFDLLQSVNADVEILEDGRLARRGSSCDIQIMQFLGVLTSCPELPEIMNISIGGRHRRDYDEIPPESAYDSGHVYSVDEYDDTQFTQGLEAIIYVCDTSECYGAIKQAVNDLINKPCSSYTFQDQPVTDSSVCVGFEDSDTCEAQGDKASCQSQDGCYWLPIGLNRDTLMLGRAALEFACTPTGNTYCVDAMQNSIDAIGGDVSDVADMDCNAFNDAYSPKCYGKLQNFPKKLSNAYQPIAKKAINLVDVDMSVVKTHCATPDTSEDDDDGGNPLDDDDGSFSGGHDKKKKENGLGALLWIGVAAGGLCVVATIMTYLVIAKRKAGLVRNARVDNDDDDVLLQLDNHNNQPMQSVHVHQPPQFSIQQAPAQGSQCMQCGSFLNPGARFCAGCGSKSVC
eukprot:m.13071 g.13071  ORF g.13071 m.13071 type:complete len:435 (-) comp4785_c0_seq2:78-1382(-)